MKKNRKEGSLHVAKVLVPIIAMAVLSAVVLIERGGIRLKDNTGLKAPENLVYSGKVVENADTLVLVDRDNDYSIGSADAMEFVLSGMKASYVEADAATFDYSRLPNYKKLVLALPDWGQIGQNMGAVMLWVTNGGQLMNTMTPDPDAAFLSAAHGFGIMDGGESYCGITGFTLVSGSMIGAEEKSTYHLADNPEDLMTSLLVALESDCKISVTSEDGKVPLIWEKENGKGRLVFINFNVSGEKYNRGFLAYAYSKLGDECLYPVINASAYYLDDFPSPVPGGDSTYIQRDYGLDTGTFYSTIWWPRVMKWEKDYGIVHTGLIIEDYSDDTDGPFPDNASTSQFVNYGNMLLNNGGELGFHGYNHQPLCLEGTDDAMQFGSYNLWPTIEAMQASLTELNSFSERLFPENEFRVYVPPSNIISPSGRGAIRGALPEVSIMASSFLGSSEEPAYVQEFGIDKDFGFIDTPRITSGTIIDDYALLTEVSELNFQYVQSHFMHPDDTLDPDRGADKGWETMAESFEKYLGFIKASAPSIRNVTGSFMGTAVAEYTNLTVKTEETTDGLSVSLGNFAGDASFLLRVNADGARVLGKGCAATEVGNGLFLVHTTQSEFYISIEK